ncbi:MAG: response regulator transcription factor [Ruminococcaceae bacterium]|nr:response regulator transcription factor [Oscillospiraceae bacterium]
MYNILVVDDEANIRNVIKEYCEFEGFSVTEATDGREAVQMCRSQKFDVVVLDVMLPTMDGFSVCREIRKQEDIPVIMLSARGEEYDKLFGFELGIEDYMVKPFSPMELMARIKVVLRRHAHHTPQTQQQQDSSFKYETLIIDMERRSVYVDGEEVMLAPKDYDLLFYLVKNKNKAFSREALLADVFGYEFPGNGRIVDTHIKLIRNSLGRYRDFIVTLRSMGYKFEVPER